MSRSSHGKQSTCCARWGKLTRWLQQVHQVRRDLTRLQQRQVRQRPLQQQQHPPTPPVVPLRRKRLLLPIRQRKMNFQGRARASLTLSEECRRTKRFVAPFDRNRCPRQPAALRPRVRTRSRLPMLRQVRVLRQLPVLRRLPLRPQASNGSRSETMRDGRCKSVHIGFIGIEQRLPPATCPR